jgi:molybdenum cofactor cytidylyltransferase
VTLNKNKPKKITAIVLAAGMGSRFGGDKLSAKIQVENANHTNSHLAIGLVSALNIKAYVDEVICIVRPDDHMLKQNFVAHGLIIIDNPDYLNGLSSSINTGIKACTQSSHYMICLADMPYIQGATYQKVIEHFFNDQTKICRPMFPIDNSAEMPLSGHPVIFPNQYKEELLQLQGDEGAMPLLKKYGFRKIALDDKGIIDDIDKVSDIRS